MSETNEVPATLEELTAYVVELREALSDLRAEARLIDDVEIPDRLSWWLYQRRTWYR